MMVPGVSGVLCVVAYMTDYSGRISFLFFLEAEQEQQRLTDRLMQLRSGRKTQELSLDTPMETVMKHLQEVHAAEGVSAGAKKTIDSVLDTLNKYEGDELLVPDFAGNLDEVDAETSQWLNATVAHQAPSRHASVIDSSGGSSKSPSGRGNSVRPGRGSSALSRDSAIAEVMPPLAMDEEQRSILNQVKSDLGEWSLDTLALDGITGRPLCVTSSAPLRLSVCLVYACSASPRCCSSAASACSRSRSRPRPRSLARFPASSSRPPSLKCTTR